MKFFSFAKTNDKKNTDKVRDTKQELLVKQGREQFKKLLDKGLGIPVVLL